MSINIGETTYQKITSIIRSTITKKYHRSGGYGPGYEEIVGHDKASKLIIKLLSKELKERADETTDRNTKKFVSKLIKDFKHGTN